MRTDITVIGAAFVWGLIRRVFAPGVPTVRWVAGGRQAVVDRMTGRTRQLGVRVELGSRITVLPDHPAIVTTKPRLRSRRGYSMQDPATAPPGTSLFQLDMPVRDGERPADARQRLERFAELTVPGWQDRAVWRRQGTARAAAPAPWTCRD
ncbi:hypothetical protein OEIGOIKO_07162 [Streptomyces chrestomyceticus JCM 4735]|uniref:Uncharacterized protein n=1 Tax=Streptomyces chrestomyceticus JCM 4735 TaxID=1306181 RepID=A0A7U9L2Q0_9ACTN|nr:hypothetical protein [Streptomyces chrestomyceticus]GCD39332.1 hypothetical protein OEIGOIKO_07162 [Streptomyces chrestomyceticus JCM 4735]